MPARGLIVGAAAVAAALLGGILVAAAALHDAVHLAYDSPNGVCRTLTVASAHDLSSALRPVRFLVAVWVVATGAALTACLSRAVGARPLVWLGGALTVAVFAVWEQAFIGTDVLSAFFPLAILWPLVVATVVASVAAAVVRRRDPAAPWLWTSAAWLLVAGGALPVALLRITADGAIRSC